jgi:hypothetical protein
VGKGAAGAGESKENPPGSGHDVEIGSRISKGYIEKLPANRGWEYSRQYSEFGRLRGSVQNPSEDIERGNASAGSSGKIEISEPLNIIFAKFHAGAKKQKQVQPIEHIIHQRKGDDNGRR